MADHIYSLTAEAHRFNATKMEDKIASLHQMIANLKKQQNIALAMADYIDSINGPGDGAPSLCSGRAESVDLFSQDAQREVDLYETQVPESDMN